MVDVREPLPGLAAEHSGGAHTYLVPPEHTAHARDLLGPGKLLVPEQAVLLETDPARARETGRQHLRRYLPLPNYTTILRRLGYTDTDLAGNGSDRLIDALVAWGDLTTIKRRVDEHHQAGADHICIPMTSKLSRSCRADAFGAPDNTLEQHTECRNRPTIDIY